jgi:hypothetical protein
MITYIFTVIIALIVALAYRQGIKDGQKLNSGEEIKFFDIPEKETETTREELIRSNIENYNGSEEGQVDLID